MLHDFFDINDMPSGDRAFLFMQKRFVLGFFELP